MILFYMITPTKATVALAATTPSGRNIDMLRFLPIALGDAGFLY